MVDETLPFKPQDDAVPPGAGVRFPILVDGPKALAPPLTTQLYSMLKLMLKGDSVKFDDDTMTITIEGSVRPQPDVHNDFLGLVQDLTRPPVAADFSVSGKGGLAIPDIPAGQRRHVIGAKPVVDGPITAVYYYAVGHRNERSRLGSVFLLSQNTINLNGVDYAWIYSQAALPSNFSGRIVEII